MHLFPSFFFSYHVITSFRLFEVYKRDFHLQAFLLSLVFFFFPLVPFVVGVYYRCLRFSLCALLASFNSSDLFFSFLFLFVYLHYSCSDVSGFISCPLKHQNGASEIMAS